MNDTVVPQLRPDELRLAAAISRLELARRTSEAHSSLGSADSRLMWLLSDRRPRTFREVSEALGLEQSTVNRQVNAALRAGLLRRYRDEGHGAYLVEPTDSGFARFEQSMGLHLGLFRATLDALAPERRPDFLALLDAAVDAYAAAVADLERDPRGRSSG